MRSFAPIALLGSFLLVGLGQAQSLAEHAAAASGATIGTAAGKPLSNAITKIFGQTDTAAKKAANPASNTKLTKPEPERESAPPIQPGPGGSGSIGSIGGSGGGSSSGEPAPSRHGGFSRHPAASQYTAVTAPAPLEIPQAPRRELTAEEISSIHVGASEQDVVTALGQPESRVTIPDDGHLVEICQYWSQGILLGTVRLDNGQVINVEARTQN